MVFKMGNSLLDINVEKTRQFYHNAKIITDDCGCDGCQNFVLGADRLHSDVMSFFSQIGIDIRKPAEIMVLCPEDNGQSIYYEGFYHICGKLLSESDCWKSRIDWKGSASYSICEENMYCVSENFSVGFSNHINLKEDDFPMPIIQMETFFRRFPWVLDKENKF